MDCSSIHCTSRSCCPYKIIYAVIIIAIAYHSSLHILNYREGFARKSFKLLLPEWTKCLQNNKSILEMLLLVSTDYLLRKMTLGKKLVLERDCFLEATDVN